MEFTSDDARAHYEAVRAVLDGVVVGLDFDGTLSPVVDDPEAARLHPGAPGALLELAEVVRAVAVITGRPLTSRRRSSKSPPTKTEEASEAAAAAMSTSSQT